jgi:lipoprotein-releasing system permease protein
MSFEFFIALRHLLSRDRRAVVSVITTISILGVIIGVAALVVIIAVMDGAQQVTFKQMVDVYADIEVSSKKGLMKDYREILQIVDSDPDVTGASPILERPVALKITSGMLSDSRSMGFAMVKGVDPALEGKVSQIGQVVGQRIPGDKEIVIGSELARQLGLNLGDTLYAMTSAISNTANGPVPKTTPLTVVGIFNSGLYEVDQQIAYTSLGTCQRMNLLDDVVDTIHAKTRNTSEARAVRDRILAKLNSRFGNLYAVQTWEQLNPDFSKALYLERLGMFIILMLVIIVAALNIISTLILVTMEKTREIGVLRAVGTSRRSIRRIFLIEGALIGIIGTFLGVILGLIGCWFLKYHLHIELPAAVYGLKGLPVAVEWKTILEIVVCSIGVSLLASVIPASLAARLDIVEALRYE